MIFHVKEGTPFRELLLREGLLVDFPCGGRGMCGQCTLKIDPPTESGKGGKKPLSPEKFKAGLRLACQAVVEGDCTLTLPADKETGQLWKDPAQVGSTKVVSTKVVSTHLLYGEPRITRRSLNLEPPSLEDQQADWERLLKALESPDAPGSAVVEEAGASETEVPEPAPATGPPSTGAPAAAALASGALASSAPAAAVESISLILREAKWQVDAVLDNGSLVCVCPRSEEHVYGFAIDLGTTTVDIALHDMETGRQIGRRTTLNRQAAYGADVISRAHEFQGQRRAVRQAALDTIHEGAHFLLKEHGVSPKQVVRSTVVGNPIMIHMLHDWDPRQLTLSPYIPLVNTLVRRSPADFSWTFQEHGLVETLPLISAFVGADTMGMILALDLEHEPGSSLSIDIGTNGEIVVSRRGSLVVTSTAAGPAFEGAQIACGMRALPGAVTAVNISDDGALDLKVVGNQAPKGFCGSGLISCIAELLDAGVMDPSGRLLAAEEVEQPALKKRIVKKDKFLAFSVSPDDQVYISQKDIRELQLAKGAIRTGIDMLLAETGVKLDEIRKLRLAGNFGAGIEIEKAMRLGLIPTLPVERVDAVGNAALRGASLALVAAGYSERSVRLQRACRFMELAAKPDFQMRFAEAMFFK